MKGLKRSRDVADSEDEMEEDVVSDEEFVKKPRKA